MAKKNDDTKATVDLVKEFQTGKYNFTRENLPFLFGIQSEHGNRDSFKDDKEKCSQGEIQKKSTTRTSDEENQYGSLKARRTNIKNKDLEQMVIFSEEGLYFKLKGSQEQLFL